MNKNKAGFGLGSMIGIGVTLVVAAIVLIFGVDIITDVRDDQCEYGFDTTTNGCLNSTGGTSGVTNPAEMNASKFAIEGIAKLPEKYPVLISVIIAALIIGILMTAFLVRGRG